MLQVASGLFLVFNYTRSSAYDSIMYIIIEVNYGWAFKLFHSNNARVVFLALFLHLYKNVAMFSYRFVKVWNTGLIMMVLIIGAGFRGYVLVGSQIRFWAAIVITSLARVIPFVGEELLYFIWGGYRLSWLTLQLLFVVHFVLPFLVLGLMVLHLVFLHRRGRTRLMYSHSGVIKVRFYPFYWVKDIINVTVYLFLVALMLLYPYSIGEVELFEEANPLNRPVHIVPEWYFLPVYAILRRVPSKRVGVIIMALRILIWFAYPLFVGVVSPATRLTSRLLVYLVCEQVALRYLGMSPIAQPYVAVAIVVVTQYFLGHLLLIVGNRLVDTYFSTHTRNNCGHSLKVSPFWLWLGFMVNPMVIIGKLILLITLLVCLKEDLLFFITVASHDDPMASWAFVRNRFEYFVASVLRHFFIFPQGLVPHRVLQGEFTFYGFLTIWPLYVALVAIKLYVKLIDWIVWTVSNNYGPFAKWVTVLLLIVVTGVLISVLYYFLVVL